MDTDELLNLIRRAMDKYDDYVGEIFEDLVIIEGTILFNNDGEAYILTLAKEGSDV
jgi:hypothetical protein